MQTVDAYKRQAKRLLKSSLAESHGITKLSQAQLLVAAAQGFDSWHALEARVESAGAAAPAAARALNISLQDLANSLEAMLHRFHPKLQKRSFYTGVKGSPFGNELEKMLKAPLPSPLENDGNVMAPAFAVAFLVYSDFPVPCDRGREVARWLVDYYLASETSGAEMLDEIIRDLLRGSPRVAEAINDIELWRFYQAAFRLIREIPEGVRLSTLELHAVDVFKMELASYR